MVNKIPMENIASEEETPQHVFGNGVFWKTLAPLEEPIKYPTVGTQFHQPTSDDVPALNHIKKSNCQLNYWATVKRKYSSVAYCKYFRVIICTDKCYEVFHSMWGIGSQKENMKVEMEQN